MLTSTQKSKLKNTVALMEAMGEFSGFPSIKGRSQSIVSSLDALPQRLEYVGAALQKIDEKLFEIYRKNTDKTNELQEIHRKAIKPILLRYQESQENNSLFVDIDNLSVASKYECINSLKYIGQNFTSWVNKLRGDLMRALTENIQGKESDKIINEVMDGVDELFQILETTLRLIDASLTKIRQEAGEIQIGLTRIFEAVKTESKNGNIASQNDQSDSGIIKVLETSNTIADFAKNIFSVADIIKVGTTASAIATLAQMLN